MRAGRLYGYAVQNRHLVERGLSNHRGCHPIGFFAPHNGYAAAGQRGRQVQKFTAMVKALYGAGIEVITRCWHTLTSVIPDGDFAKR